MFVPSTSNTRNKHHWAAKIWFTASAENSRKMLAWSIRYLVVVTMAIFVSSSLLFSKPLCQTNHSFRQSTHGILTHHIRSPDQCRLRCIERETLHLVLISSSGKNSTRSSGLSRSAIYSSSVQPTYRSLQHSGCAPTHLHHLWAYYLTTFECQRNGNLQNAL